MSFTLHTKREQLNSVAKRWRQSFYERYTNTWYTHSHEEVWYKLLALTGNPSVDQVKGAVGPAYTCYAELRCTECDADVDYLIEVSMPYGYDQDAALCVQCLGNIVSQLQEALTLLQDRMHVDD